MRREFRLPDLGSGLKEAQILRWHADEGGPIQKEALLCEVETEKSVIEVPSPFTGVLVQLAASPGGRIKVGDILAIVDVSPGHAVHEELKIALLSETTDQNPIATDLPSVRLSNPENPRERRRAMPSIRKLAARLGLDLSTLPASGPGGRITKHDVLRSSPSVIDATNEPTTRRFESYSMLRRTIADHMTRSWREIPHVFTRVKADATRLIEVRDVLSEELSCKVPLDALLMFSAIPALKANPAFNATVHEDGIELHQRYDIGAAVDTPDGLLVPVLRNADRLTLAELIRDLISLQSKAASRKLGPQELKGATFTVNNIGALGRGMGTSIIPWGTTAIVSMGRIMPRVALVDGQVRNIPTLEISLAFDHRAIDGGASSRFMKALLRRIEQPAIGLLQ